MSETVTSSPAPVAESAPARKATTLAEANKMMMAAADPVASGGVSSASGESAPMDPNAIISAIGDATARAARGENPIEPEVQPEGEAAPEADAQPEAAPEPVKQEAPDFKLVKHFREKANQETQARMRAEAEVNILRGQVQQLIEWAQSQQAAQAAPAEMAPEPEADFDDYGDPAIRQLNEMRKELAELKKVRDEIEALKNERQSERQSAQVKAIEADLRAQWDAALPKYPVLANKAHANALWDMVQKNPGLTVDDAAALLQYRHGESRPGPVPASSPKPAAAQASAPKPAPPRPPPGGTAAIVAPPAKPRTIEEATRAIMAAR